MEIILQMRERNKIIIREMKIGKGMDVKASSEIILIIQN